MAVVFSDSVKAHDCGTATQAQKKEWGCDEPMIDALQWEFDGFKFDRCFQHYATRAGEWMAEVFRLYNWREKGFLPWPGGWADQPFKFVQICDLIDFLKGKKLVNKSNAVH